MMAFIHSSLEIHVQVSLVIINIHVDKNRSTVDPNLKDDSIEKKTLNVTNVVNKQDLFYKVLLFHS